MVYYDILVCVLVLFWLSFLKFSFIWSINFQQFCILMMLYFAQGPSYYDWITFYWIRKLETIQCFRTPLYSRSRTIPCHYSVGKKSGLELSLHDFLQYYRLISTLPCNTDSEVVFLCFPQHSSCVNCKSFTHTVRSISARLTVVLQGLPKDEKTKSDLYDKYRSPLAHNK